MRGGRSASGVEIEVEGELAVAVVLCPNTLQGLAGSRAHAVSLQPTLHPDVASFWFPDLGQLHNAAAARTFERVVAEGGFDPLAPFKVLEGLGQGFQVEEGRLEAKGFESGVDDWDEFAFDVAGIQASVAHCLHSLRRDVRDHTRDKVEGRAGNGNALVRVGIDVPVGDELTVVVGDV
jgi:hypothetical protein